MPPPERVKWDKKLSEEKAKEAFFRKKARFYSAKRPSISLRNSILVSSR
jgi:hypothetical protein